MLANEFSEATGNLYLSALIELGLVLFLLTFMLNGLARLLIVADHQPRKRSGAGMKPRMVWRKIGERADAQPDRASARWSLSRCCFFILGYLVYHGGKDVNWDFFTKLPTPVGEPGGGMANAIVGSGKLLLLAALVWRSHRLAGRSLPG